MSVDLIVPIISVSCSAFTALLVFLSPIFTEKIRNKNELGKNDLIQKNVEWGKVYEKKELVYSQTLWLLRELSASFSGGGLDVLKRRDRFDNIIRLSKECIPIIMLYSTDNIMHLFEYLFSWNGYSYLEDSDEELCDFEIDKFNQYRKIMAVLMQIDLKIRKYNSTKIDIDCPKCGRKHNFSDICDCGLNFNGMLELLMKNKEDIK